MFEGRGQFVFVFLMVDSEGFLDGLNSKGRECFPEPCAAPTEKAMAVPLQGTEKYDRQDRWLE